MTVTIATATGAIGTVAKVATGTGIAMATEIVTATETGIATAAADTATVVMEMVARGSEKIAGVRGMGETG